MSDTIHDRMDVVERLTNLFQFERRVYLSITLLSLGMLIASAILLVMKGEAGYAELTLMLAPTGALTYTTGRLLFMWSEALKRLMPSNEAEQAPENGGK